MLDRSDAPINPSAGELLVRFQQAIEGLFVTSESDYPIEVSLWQGQSEQLTIGQLLTWAGKPLDSLVEVVEAEDFFGRMVQDQEWHAEEDKAIVRRFQALVELIRERLTDVHVYRVGEIAIDVYVVGTVVETDIEQSDSGKAEIGQSDLTDRIVLSTKVVET